MELQLTLRTESLPRHPWKGTQRASLEIYVLLILNLPPYCATSEKRNATGSSKVRAVARLGKYLIYIAFVLMQEPILSIR